MPGPPSGTLSANAGGVGKSAPPAFVRVGWDGSATRTPRLTQDQRRITAGHPAGVDGAGPGPLARRPPGRKQADVTQHLTVPGGGPTLPQMRAGGGMSLNDSVFERLLRERIIFLGQQVDDAIANQICAQLLLLAAEDPERDITLHINSPGGSVTAGMAIYDTMQYVECDIKTVGMGLAGPRWGSSCSAPGPRASVTPCRTRGS
nr:hypothetical protein GCM10020241_22440 [Streptoalloteichus tenebrarius]